MRVILPCAWCGEDLRFDSLRGWVHDRTNLLIAGSCTCPDYIHRGPFADDGRVICPTWRDEHAGLPRRDWRDD